MLSQAKAVATTTASTVEPARLQAPSAGVISNIGSQPPGIHAQDTSRPAIPNGRSRHRDGDGGPELLKGLRTLIVEDDLIDQKIITAAARQLQLRSVVTPTALEALELLKQSDEDDPFELMLIDFKMPALDGLAASNLIKHQLKLNTVPKIILLSAYQKNEIFCNVADRQFVDNFVTKPITPAALNDILQRFHQSAKANNQQWPATAAAPTEPDEDILARTHVLLAEDNYINQRVAIGMLKQKSIQVTIASNGQEAIDKIFGSPPGTYDVVLMDMDMPKVDGYIATQTILQNPAYKDVPIIALTAHISPEDKRRCIEAGMVEYLTKPIKPDVLYEAIRNQL